MGKGLDVLRLCNAVFHKLGAARNGLKGGLKLVGNVGGKFPPHLLGFFLFGYVDYEQGDGRHLFIA